MYKRAAYALWAFLILSYLGMLAWGWSIRPAAKAEWGKVHGTHIPPEQPGEWE